jgi:isopentenyl-diphosphate delta-isomerase
VTETRADEPFETFAADGTPLGVRRRADVHRLGLWHRAANVLLFDRAGRLVLQRRSLAKDLWPDAWDVSVGEHLAPGERYEDAAHRGLAEEIGVRGIVLRALGDVVRASVEIPADGVVDNELQQTFTAIWEGPFAPDPDEVSAVRVIGRDALAEEVALGVERFTPWLLARLERLGWLGSKRPG